MRTDDLLGLILGCGCKKKCCCEEKEAPGQQRPSTLFQTQPRTVQPPRIPDDAPFVPPPPPAYDSPQRPHNAALLPYSTDAGVFQWGGTAGAADTPKPFPETFQLTDGSTIMAGHEIVISTSTTAVTLNRVELPGTPITINPLQEVRRGVSLQDEYTYALNVVATRHLFFVGGVWVYFADPKIYSASTRAPVRLRPVDVTVETRDQATGQWLNQVTTTTGAVTAEPLTDPVVIEAARQYTGRYVTEDGHACEYYQVHYEYYSDSTGPRYRRYLLALLDRNPELPEDAQEWAVLNTKDNDLDFPRPTPDDMPPGGRFSRVTSTDLNLALPLEPLPPRSFLWETADHRIRAEQPITTPPSQPTLTAYGHSFTGGTWAGLRGPEGEAWLLYEHGGPVSLIKPDGSVTQTSRLAFETQVLRAAEGTFFGFSPVGGGSHSWPPQWAWAVLGSEARAMTLWDAWRDSTKLEWPARPRRRPRTPPANLSPPPLGLTLATPGPPLLAEEALRLGQAPAHLPSTVQVQKDGVWTPSVSAQRALAKRFLFPAANWPEEINDSSSVRGPIRVTFGGVAMPQTGLTALLFRTRPKGLTLPTLTVNGVPAQVYRLGHSPLERGFQPYLAVTSLGYPASLGQPLTIVSPTPLTRLLLAPVPGTVPDPDPDPGGGNN